jgi:MFS family permease
MSSYSILIKNKNLIVFSVLLTFFSGFGQTFLLALYVPFITEDFSIESGQFGTLYALVTILSAASIPYLGKLIDKYPLRLYAYAVIIGLSLSLVMVSQASNIFYLMGGVWGLRLFGQGLMGHTATTSVLKFFEKGRGKALSISALGYPLSQAVFPTIITFVIFYSDWRSSMLYSGILVFILLIPAIFLLLKNKTFEQAAIEASTKNNEDFTKTWSQKDILKDKRFYLIAPGILIIPFLITGLFFYQVPIAEYKGWDTQWLAFCFIGYSISNAVGIIFSGPLTDKFSAINLFPIFLFPFLIALIVLLSFDGKWICMVYLILAGLSVGFGATVRSAIQAELYGIKTIGAVRSLFATFMIIFTALGPFVLGIFFDYKIEVSAIILFCIALLSLAILSSFGILYFSKKQEQPSKTEGLLS